MKQKSNIIREPLGIDFVVAPSPLPSEAVHQAMTKLIERNKGKFVVPEIRKPAKRQRAKNA